MKRFAGPSTARPAAGVSPAPRRPKRFCYVLVALFASVYAPAVIHADAAPLLGISWPTWSARGYEGAEAQVKRFVELGFREVTMVPTYTYSGLQRIESHTTPSAEAQEKAMGALLRAGLSVVYKPHLDAPRFQPGFQAWKSDNHSWRASCPWRGYFDVDPMAEAYREGVVFRGLAIIERALAAKPERTLREPIRFELGSELMNSVVYTPEAWVKLLRATRRELKRRKLEGRVLLSHNFSHHFEIAEDFVDRMPARARRALATYIRGLDALALSQYMDLTIAMPKEARESRLPSAAEVGRALLLHERALREEILGKKLGLGSRAIPPIYLGEFGIGRGGLRHPNLWEGSPSAAEIAALNREVARGFEGLAHYLASPERSTKGVTLWVTGRFFDIFGLYESKYAIAEASTALRPWLVTGEKSREKPRP